MSKLITNNWKRILIILGSICIAFILYKKIVIKPNIVKNYLDSDINIESDIFDGVHNGAEQVTDKVEDNLENNPTTSENDTMQNVIKWALIIGGLFILLLLLDSIIQGSGDSKKK